MVRILAESGNIQYQTLAPNEAVFVVVFFSAGGHYQASYTVLNCNALTAGGTFISFDSETKRCIIWECSVLYIALSVEGGEREI